MAEAIGIAILTWLGASTATAAAYGAVVGTAVMMVGMTALSMGIQAMMPRPSPPGWENLSGITLMSYGSNEASRVIYGETVVSGTVLAKVLSGPNNEYLHILIGLAGHEIESVSDVWLGDTLSTDARFTGYARLLYYTGAADQAASPELLAEVPVWTADHRLRGIAYLYVRLKWNANVWVSGVPNIKAKVKGRKVYDPRTGTTAWSANGALCRLDHLIGTRPLASGTLPIGIGATLSEVDEPSWCTAATIADEDVPLAAGGTQNRYVCNGSFATDQRPIDVAGDLASATGGIQTVYRQGKYYGYVAAYEAPVLELDADDLRGELSISARPSRRDLFNTVTGSFVDKNNFYQPTPFPEVSNAAYLAEDGERLVKDIVLPYTDDFAMAQRLAKIVLERGRRATSIKFPGKLTVLPTAAHETLMLTIAQLGYDAEVFRITDWTLAEDGGIDLVLLIESADLYAWDAEEQALAAPPDVGSDAGKVVDPPGNFTVVDETVTEADGSQTSYLHLSWDAPTDIFVVSGGRAEAKVYDNIYSEGGGTGAEGDSEI